MTLHPGYPVGGCDVSYWQGAIDFDAMADSGIQFIIIKSSEGSFNDPNYQTNKAGAIQSGLPFGAYHYWRPGYTVSQNVLAMDRQVPNRPPVGCWLDLEAPSNNLTRLQTSAHIYQTLLAMDINYNSLTGIYCNVASWQRLIDPSYYDRLDLDKRPLWVANYFDVFVNQPHLPDGWPGWLIWQYKIYDSPGFGVSSKKIDIDAFNGTTAQFYQFIGSTVEPPPEVLPVQIRTKTIANVRNAPTLINSDVGNFDPDKVMNVITKVGTFYKVEIYVSESVVEPVIIPPPPTIPEYRVCHDTEYQTQWRGLKTGVPEVFHFDQDAPTPLTKEWQEFIVALNPGISGDGYRSLCKWDRAFTNGTGYDNPNGNVYADFINHRNEGAKLPVVDKSRCCGAAILRGILSGDVLTIETLDGTKPPPSIEWVRARPWLYFRCYTIRPDGTNGDFPQNGGKPVYFPLIASGKVTVKVNMIIPAKPYPYVKI